MKAGNKPGSRLVKKRIVIAALVLTSILVGWWVYQQLEFKEVEVDVGLQGEAARNPLLAFQKMLTQMDREVEVATARSVFPDHPKAPEVAVLIEPAAQALDDPKGFLDERLSQGGHLIYALPRGVDETPLLEALGWRVRGNQQSEQPTTQKIEWRDAIAGEMRLASGQRLHNPETGETRPWLSKQIGKGRITVVAEKRWLTGLNPGKADHASLLWQAVHHHHDSPTRVWLVHRAKWPSLWHELWRQAPAVILSLLMLAALAAWRLRSGWGPLAPDPPRARRSLSEHLSASGLLLWRTGATASLLAPMRRHAAQCQQQRGLDTTADLASMLGIPEERLRHSLDPQHVPTDQQELIQIVQDLKRVQQL